MPDRPKCGKCGRPLLLDRPVPLNDDDFERTVGGSDLPVLVDFYADWCGPCKMMAPAFDDIARRRQGEALVAKINTDLAPKTSAAFQIRSIPTTILFRNGKEAARQVGAVPGGRLEEMLGA
jgi:thioredoxin 2